MPYLNKILLYPIKSLDGISVDRATILNSGALAHDREFAIVDHEGNYINGKRTAKVHGIRSKFDLDARTVTLQAEEMAASTFHLDDDRISLEQSLSHYFGFSVRLIQDTNVGFPDDTNSPGPTVISTESLQVLTHCFPDLDVEAIRRRFRSNLEISGGEPFWEDRLFGDTNETVKFQIGEVQLEGVNPCQRCIVPTRDAITGEAYPNFQKTFITQRKETFPDWAERSHFNHFFRLAVNTRIYTGSHNALQTGDTVTLTIFNQA